MSIEAIIAIIGTVMCGLDVVLWHGVAGYRNRLLLGLGAVLIGVTAIMLAL